MMIPGALHGRRGGAIVSPPGYDGVTYQAEQIAASGPVTATLSALWLSVGEWAVTGVLSPGSGNWIVPTAPGVGAGYELRITVTQTFGDGVGLTLNNPASTWVPLSSNRTLMISSFKPSGLGANLKQFTLTIEIRRASDGVVVSTASTFAEVNAEITA